MPVEPSLANDAVGAVLNGQWKLRRMIGEGGLAGVFEAEGLSGQGRRAIKLLHQQFTTQPHVVERFYNEAKACYELRHPHIAAVQAYAYAEDGSPYIVMELLEGVSLEDYLARGRPLAPADVVHLGTGILQALSVAHARGIVHRDLKPANLFLVQDAHGRWQPKVLDFGIAKVMDLAGGMGSKTRTGALLGTPGYMSPEQIKDAKAVDARCDLWAVGVVLYEMLLCRHPFDSSDKLARMIAVLREEPKLPSQWVLALAGWDPFFRRALAREPADRFQSAEQMASALQEQGRPLAAPAAAAVPAAGGEGRTVAMPMAVAVARAPGGDPASALGAGSVVPGTAASPGAQALPALGPASAVAAPAATPVGLVGAGAAVSPAPPGPAGVTPPPGTPPARPDDDSLPIDLAVPMMSTRGPYPGGFGGMPMAPAPMPSEAVRGAQRTQISGDAPPSVAADGSGIAPVRVLTAADEEPPSLVWWGVVLVGLACLALGMGLGYLLAS